MNKLVVSPPRKWLKDIGFQFDVNPTQRDRRFLKLLSPEDRDTVEKVWAAAKMGIDISSELYAVPKTLAQATALFSHDADRYVASMQWISEVVSSTKPASIFDVGCGAGLLLKFLLTHYPLIEAGGIDAAPNLVQIASALTGRKLVAGDYLHVQPDKAYDLIVCEFGYDNADTPESTKPHSTAYCGKAAYCPGCAEDAQSHFEKYFLAWRHWSKPESALAIAGRMTTYTDIRAITSAAGKVGWFVDLSLSTIMKVNDKHNGTQYFPAWYFTSSDSNAATEEEVANFYMSKGKR